MTYLPKAQEQMNGDLLVPECTKLFLHRIVLDLQARLEQAADAELERLALTTLQTALGPCHEPLAPVREMLDLPDPQEELRGRNLMRVTPHR